MSRSERESKGGKLWLKVSSDEDGVRITVLNQRLVPVAEGVRELNKQLPQGLYGVRFEAGGSVREQIVALTPESTPLIVRQKAIAFPASAPLAGTRKAIPEQADAAAEASRRVNRSLGAGGRLLLFVRDRDLRASSNPASGLTVHSPDEEISADVAQDGEFGGGRDEAHPPWAACSYALAPGAWRLRCPAPGGRGIEQTVMVCHGWQTQVFLQRSRSRAGRRRRANLADASVLMARYGTGFNPSGRGLRTAELARQALRDHRMAVPSDELEMMVFKKGRNPMLAIYGAHLMIHRENPDRELVRGVAEKLTELIGEHPDVRALHLWLGDLEGAGVFPEPPMLKSSWSIIVKASAKHPHLVPRRSRAAGVAERVLAAGPWLCWRSAGTSAARAQGEPHAPEKPLGWTLAQLASQLPSGLYTEAKKLEVSPVESQVLALAEQVRERSDPVSDADVVRALGVPRTVAEDAMSTVIERFLD